MSISFCFIDLLSTSYIPNSEGLDKEEKEYLKDIVPYFRVITLGHYQDETYKKGVEDYCKQEDQK